MIPESSQWRVLTRVLQVSATEISAEVIVPPNSLWFCGHFPKDPVLPAIAQLNIIYDIIQQFHSVHLIEIKRVRFRRIIRPNERIYVSVGIHTDGSRSCSFKMSVNEEIACNGILIIEEKKDNVNRE